MRWLKFGLILFFLLGMVIGFPGSVLSAIDGTDEYQVTKGVSFGLENGPYVGIETNISVANRSWYPDNRTIQIPGYGEVSGQSDVYFYTLTENYTNATIQSTNRTTFDMVITDYFRVNGSVDRVNFSQTNYGDREWDLIYESSAPANIQAGNLSANTKYSVVNTQTGNTVASGTADNNGIANFTVSAGSQRLAIVQNLDPVINQVYQKQIYTPGFGQNVTVSITDQNGLNDVDNITMVLYRNDTSAGAPDDPRDHYTLTYYTENDTVVSPYGSTVDGLNVNENTDNLTVSWAPVKYAAPSSGTSNSTVNNYTWQIETTVYDISGSTDQSVNETEMAKRVGILLNTSKISTNPQPGETGKYTPNIGAENDGNVYVNITYKGTNQTAPGSSDFIPVSRVVIDDDNQVDETTETGLPQNTYDTSTQILGVDTKYNTTDTIYHWVRVPNQIEEGTYTGNVTIGATESGT